MAQSALEDSLVRAEGLLIEGADEDAERMLARLAEDAEEYVDRNCPTTDELQWFAFPTIFERLCYRRVEEDPRELRDVGEPFGRMYNDLALAQVRLGDYAAAAEALKRAIRWNPMDCGARLDLAHMYMTNGDMNEFLGLTFSVFERASDARHLVRAFLNFAGYFVQTKKPQAAAAALRCARRLEMPDPALEETLKAAAGTDQDPDKLTDEQATQILAEEGLPDAANAEVAVCLLMCASDAAAAGDRAQATTWTVTARDLVGAPACSALMQLINEGDATQGGE